jgi:single-strand DNA-binding protein
MASVNKVIIVGNLGKDPEVRYMPSGSALCNVSVATTRQWKDKTSGEKQQETEWHRVTFFDRMAEIAGEYLKKGSAVYVEGRLKTRKYTDKDGVEKYSTDIVATEMQLLGGRDTGGASMGAGDDMGEPQQRSAPAARPAAPARSAPTPRQPAKSPTGFDDMDDDIPF